SGHGKRSYVSEVDFPEVNDGAEYLASLWAGRKIGYLLDQIRLNGSNKELVNEIVELSTKYGILTEYTAFLANEDTTAPRAAAPGKAMDAMAGAFSQRGGGWATSQTQNAQVMRQATNVASQNRYLDAEGREVQVANVQNRGQRGFVARAGQWQDMRYDPASRKVDLQVQAYSEAHFQLSRSFPALNQSLAVSDNMIVVVNGKAVQIGPEGKTKLTDEELKALGASTATTTGSAGTTLEAPRMAEGGRGLLAGGLATVLAMLALPRRRRG
ncbi:MAG: hypothetical protein ABFE16_06000, partial [Armatimonadia bacterium]